jgi:hypothetical protein
MTLIKILLTFTERKDENYISEYCSMQSVFPSETNAALPKTAQANKSKLYSTQCVWNKWDVVSALPREYITSFNTM